MAYLSDKDGEKIENNLRSLIKEKLLQGFQNRRYQKVISVDSVYIVDYNIDEEKSDRDNIVVQPVNSIARVWVEVGQEPGSSTNNELTLLINNPVVFSYDDNEKAYVLRDPDQVAIINMTQD